MNKANKHHRRIGQLESELLAALKRIAKLEAEKAHLEKVAHEDHLTGVANRRGLQQRLDAITEVVARHPGQFKYPEPYYLVADLDHFKSVNDTHGHAAGDAVLQQFAQLLASNVRAYDVVARLGGEEFVLLLVDISAAEASAKAQQIAQDVRGHRFSLPSGEELKLTCSFGLARTIDAADKLLYQAKQGGRDQVVVEPVS